MNRFVLDYTISLAIVGTLAVLTTIFVPGGFGVTSVMLTLAASLAFMDAARWMQGRRDLFDPAVILGLFAPIFLVLGPMVQMGTDYWLAPVQLTDPSYLSLWALLQLSGFILFRLVVDWPRSHSPPAGASAVALWRPPSNFLVAALIVLAIGVITQAALYSHYGGIGGWVATYTFRQRINYRNFTGFDDIGPLVLLGEVVKFTLPTLLILIFGERSWARTRSALLALLMVTFTAAVIFGGLRGSRSSIIYAVVFAMCIYHFRIRRISRIEVLLLAGAGLGFIVVYMFFKFGGIDGVMYLLGASDKKPLASRFDVPLQYVFSRDLSRMDIQSFVLEKRLGESYPLTYGRSFLFAITAIIPGFLHLNLPPHFIFEKVEYLLGPGRFTSAQTRQVTMLFGGMGEFTIAFGLAGALLFFAALGAVVRWAREIRPNIGSPRLLLWPFLSLVGVQLMLLDSASFVLFYFKIMFPMLFVFALWGVLSALAPQRRIRPPGPEGA